ncbi:transmembrane protein 237-like isoform X2 [Lineus longissimus]|uniref:transmembrane protein 237-like isoform X2 n=1 Tax=Lineus longissimus TaxID=88925 RepID=UPI00315D1ABD
MADDLGNKKPKSRKLPPLGGTGGADDKEGSENVPKPRPKKKKRPTTAKAAADGQDFSESGQAGSAAGPGPGEGSVRKKKRRPRPKPAGGEEGPSADTGGDVVDGDQATPRARKPRKKSPRKPKQDASGSQHSLIGQSEEVEGEPETPRRTPRKKKRRTPRSSRTNLKDEYANGGLAADLADLEDDIIDGVKSETEADDEDDEEDVVNAPSGVNLKSQPANKLYIEQKSRFRQEDKQKLARRLAEIEERRLAAETEEPKGASTLDFALSSQKGLRIFSLFIHGILGGFAICQFSFVVLILLGYSYTEFLDLYNEIAWPVQVAYYLMFVICTVSALDRFDVCRMNRRFLIQCLTMQNGAISILFYFVAMILSLSIADTDDKMRLYGVNSTFYWGDATTADDLIYTWRNVNIARGCFAVVAWFIIALQPTYDRLSQNLKSGEENILGEGREMNSVSAV